MLVAALAITVESNKGVVITGAFRPHTAYDADGPQNIIDSIVLAATLGWSAEYHEAAITMHGDILLPWGLYKDDNQFKTGFGSRIGRIEGSKAYFRNVPRRCSPEKFDISDLSLEDPLPEVVIITVYSGFDVKLMRMAVPGGARGVILVVYDDKYIPTRAGQEIEDLIKEYDIVVIGVNYSPSGTITYERVNGVIPGGDRNSRQV